MTAVVGLVHDGRVHLGADSALTAGWALTISAQPKVFRRGPYVIGTSGSPRMAQVMRYSFEPPPLDGEPHRFMATAFIDAMRQVLKDAGVATKTADQEATGGSFALVGIAGRLFEIQSDYQVSESVDGFAAIGSGFEPCLGALHATPGRPVRERLRIALEAAERFNAAVHGPFVFVASKRVAA